MKSSFQETRVVSLFYALLFIFTLLCLVLCGLVLVQESKSMGLGSSFGVDSGDSVFGVSTPDVLKKATAWLAVAFCCGCLLLSFVTNHLGHEPHSAYPQQEAVDENYSSEDPASAQ